MSEIARALRKSRQFQVTVGKFKFTVRRPTDVEAIAIHQENMTFDKIASKFVIGWEGVTVDAIQGGGSMTVPEFDREDWEEWCADRPDFWQPISLGLWERYSKHIEKAEAAGKV